MLWRSSNDILPVSAAPKRSFWFFSDEYSAREPSDDCERDSMRHVECQRDLPPPPPPPRAETVISLIKPRRTALGVRFQRDPGADGGAVVASVEAYGLGWRSGLAWGDNVLMVREVHRDGEVIGTSRIHDGYDAAQFLKPAQGRIELIVLRRRRTAKDAAASLLQAHAKRWRTRLDQLERHAAATIMAAHWRRFCAECDLEDALEEKRAEAQAEEWLRLSSTSAARAGAAVTLQASWRRYCAVIRACDRFLALERIQRSARAFMTRRTRQRERREVAAGPGHTSPNSRRLRSWSPELVTTKRSRHTCTIRAPPQLLDDVDSQE